MNVVPAKWPQTRTVRTVLAHGCFDLLHLGHIRHLQHAKALGDRLVVSVTGDAYVNKGAGRPHFTAAQRADALRALSCVDEVVVTNDQDATGTIGRICPYIYVKGLDYKDDASAGLAREKAAVEAVGGKIIFTDSEKFSSSRLLNTEKFSPEVCEYLETCRIAGFRDKILKAFEDADKLKIAFVGEAIIDEYRYGRGLGRASKELMLATVEVGDEQFEGGVVAASNHAEWKNTSVVSAGSHMKKTRFVDADFNRKLFDVYSAKTIQANEVTPDLFRKNLVEKVANSDVVVVFDFGHGLIGPVEQDFLYGAKFLAVNAQTNAGNYGYNLIIRYSVADFICIDDPEARLAAQMPTEPIEQVVNHGLAPHIACNRYLVTHGRHGSYYRDLRLRGDAPAFSLGGIDTMGAGDAVVAVTAPLVAAGLPLNAAALVGNVAGAIKTSIVGHRRHVGRQEIVKTVEALPA